ncbi:MAG TPA: hypothetical protein VKA70_06780 [Blastocatellia bacterium]|nr:hypothetical protein [Blastocatellia bacterium]
MSKTVKILWLITFLLVAVSAAIIYLGPEIEIRLRPKPEDASSHGGYTLSGWDPYYGPIYEKWWEIADYVLILPFAVAVAAVRVWFQDMREKKETLKEHLANSNIINIEGKNANRR